MADNTFANFFFHTQKFVLLAFEHFINRNAGPAGDNLRDIIGGDSLGNHGALAFSPFIRCEFFLQIRNQAIGKFTGLLIFAFALRIGEIGAGLFQLLFDFLRGTKFVFLGFPALCERS